jgi:hypothetical protein
MKSKRGEERRGEKNRLVCTAGFFAGKKKTETRIPLIERMTRISSEEHQRNPQNPRNSR